MSRRETRWIHIHGINACGVRHDHILALMQTTSSTILAQTSEQVLFPFNGITL